MEVPVTINKLLKGVTESPNSLLDWKMDILGIHNEIHHNWGVRSQSRAG